MANKLQLNRISAKENDVWVFSSSSFSFSYSPSSSSSNGVFSLVLIGTRYSVSMRSQASNKLIQLRDPFRCKWLVGAYFIVYVNSMVYMISIDFYAFFMTLTWIRWNGHLIGTWCSNRNTHFSLIKCNLIGQCPFPHLRCADDERNWWNRQRIWVRHCIRKV